MRSLLLLVSIVLSAASAESLKSHAVPNSSMTLSVPENWKQTDTEADIALVLRSPADAPPSTQASMTVAKQVLEKPQSLDEYATASIGVIDRMLSGVRVLDNAPATVNQREWRRIHYRFRAGQQLWEQVMFVNVDGTTGWCVTCSCAQEDWGKWQKTFDEIAESLRL
jgi:hypothetical protein